MRYLLLLLPLLAACSKADKPELPAPVASTALYRVTFEASWRADTHANYPAGAHFSPPIGTAHAATSGLFAAGRLASRGIQDMAERGNNTALRAEIEAQRTAGTAGSLYGHNVQGRNFDAAGMVSDTVRVSLTHPALSVVSMIAPSPDWYVALEQADMRQPNGQWKTELLVPALAYDAGTDSGSAFTAANQATSPAQPITKLLLPPASGTAPDGPPLGQWRIVRLK